MGFRLGGAAGRLGLERERLGAVRLKAVEEKPDERHHRRNDEKVNR